MSPRGYPGTRSPHGTITRYFAQGCRCEICLQRAREYQGTRQSRADYETERKAQADAKHGFEWTYVRGCRCDECREASRAARAKRRSRATA